MIRKNAGNFRRARPLVSHFRRGDYVTGPSDGWTECVSDARRKFREGGRVDGRHDVHFQVKSPQIFA